MVSFAFLPQCPHQTQSHSVFPWSHHSTSTPLPKIFPTWGPGRSLLLELVLLTDASPETASYLVLSSIHCWPGASRRDKRRQRPWAGSPEAVSST